HSSLRRHQLRLRRIDCRLFDGELHLQRLRIELDQNIAFFYPVIVIHQHTRNLSPNTRGNERDITVYVSVISRNGVPGVKRFRDYDEDDDGRADDDQGSSQPAFFRSFALVASGRHRRTYRLIRWWGL